MTAANLTCPRRRRSGRIAALAAALGVVLPALPAEAHGIYFAQRAKQIALIYGVGADDLDMVRRMPLLNSTTAWDEAWKPVTVTLRVAGPIPVVDAAQRYVALAATMDYGMWTKRPDGEFVNKGKDEVPGAILSERTVKATVFLAGLPKGPVPLLAGHRLQVVPVGAIPTEAGRPATFKVMYDGKPCAGAQVLTDFINDPDMPRLWTGPDGTVSFRLRNQGLNVIEATFDGPSDQPAKYDRIEYSATLGFVLPHADE